MLRSLRGESTWLPAAISGVVFVVDGLGAIQLRAHRAHARHLAGAMPKKHVARTVFPSTTAAALTSILTGAEPGEHGLVGYRTLDPDRDVLTNQLNGYERDGLDPDTWQRSETVFQRASRAGIRGYAVGMTAYESTGLTSAIMRGAEYIGEDDLAQRVQVACALASQEPDSFVYCYLPELDQVGHRHGVDSDAWTQTLEAIDLALRPALSLPPTVGAVVTADHGMIDVPRHRHVLLADGDPRLDGVRHLGGEPRLLHVYREGGVDADELAERWRRESAQTADVSTREQALSDGLFGTVMSPHVPARIGDVLVAARGSWAFYDDRLADKGPQKMIGQHGSITPEETSVPLIRLGAYAN
ncbi:alkaline phosphatase family protein [Microbacterium sp. G2-8]|uniref:alkaline phosphatase family protein n=1 Tax=Microbacterium sp. G2-8 TaxID=2842454 RepID=UPI0021A9CD19|nr:nucleotide pyrophosphatase/phosphodiesterase family protein [Microbacterium sp. G2-8]